MKRGRPKNWFGVGKKGLVRAKKELKKRKAAGLIYHLAKVTRKGDPEYYLGNSMQISFIKVIKKWPCKIIK